MPTRVEAFIDEQIEKLLVPGEAIEAHGFLRSPINGWLSAFRARDYFLALTTNRLFAFEARRGVLHPLLEKRRRFVCLRASISVVVLEGEVAEIAFPLARVIRVVLNYESQHSATQATLVGALLADHRAELPQATLVRRRDDS